MTSQTDIISNETSSNLNVCRCNVECLFSQNSQFINFYYAQCKINFYDAPTIYLVVDLRPASDPTRCFDHFDFENLKYILQTAKLPKEIKNKYLSMRILINSATIKKALTCQEFYEYIDDSTKFLAYNMSFVDEIFFELFEKKMNNLIGDGLMNKGLWGEVLTNGEELSITKFDVHLDNDKLIMNNQNHWFKFLRLELTQDEVIIDGHQYHLTDQLVNKLRLSHVKRLLVNCIPVELEVLQVGDRLKLHPDVDLFLYNSYGYRVYPMNLFDIKIITQLANVILLNDFVDRKYLIARYNYRIAKAPRQKIAIRLRMKYKVRSNLGAPNPKKCGIRENKFKRNHH